MRSTKGTRLSLLGLGLLAISLAALFPVGVSFAQTCTPSPSGMVSWWPGDGNANDIVGGNHGTLQNGAAFAAGKVGQAFSFDGVDDFVRIPISPSLQTVSNAITIDMWVKLNSLPSTRPVPFSGPGALLLNNHIQNFGSPVSGVTSSVNPSGAVTFQTRLNNICCQAVTSNGVLQIGIWHHIAGVWDGANLRLYIDGTLDNIVPASGTLQMNRDIFLGINADNFFGGIIANQVDGLIDEVEIFNRALSAAEIQAIFNAGSAGKCKVVPFAAFAAKVEIELGPLANDDKFELKSTFTLGSGSDGIDPLTEDVAFQVGTFSTTIPAGSFKFRPAEPGKKGKPGKPARWTVEGMIDGGDLEAKITDLGGGSFEFKAEGEGADLTGTANPVTVKLKIGDDEGSTTVTANDDDDKKEGKDKDDKKDNKGKKK